MLVGHGNRLPRESGGILVPGMVQKTVDAFHSLGTWFRDVLGSVSNGQAG